MQLHFGGFSYEDEEEPLVRLFRPSIEDGCGGKAPSVNSAVTAGKDRGSGVVDIAAVFSASLSNNHGVRRDTFHSSASYAALTFRRFRRGEGVPAVKSMHEVAMSKLRLASPSHSTNGNCFLLQQWSVRTVGKSVCTRTW